jgi:ABC-type glycerol-3-phosphate transport system substrate-binding protein
MTDREETLQNLTEQYEREKHSRVKIHLELYAPSKAYQYKVRAAAQTNTLPDIFGVLGETRDLASFIVSGHVSDISAALDADDGHWRKQFFPKALATTTFNEGNQYKVSPGTYGIPIDVTNIQMLYNKEIFKQAGLNPEEPPKTWEEFIDAWHKLAAAGKPGFVSGWGETWMIDCFASNYAFNIMGEQKVLDTFRGKVPYTDPGWIKVLEIFDAMRREGLLVPGVVTMVNKTAEQTFANNNAAFAFNGSWCVNVYKGMNPDLSYGVMLPPSISSRYPMKIWGGAGSSFVINAASPYKKEALDYLKWLTSPAQQAVLSRETMNLPSNRNSMNDLPPLLAGFAAGMDSTTHPSEWPVVEDPIVVERFDRGIQSILTGEKTPAEIAQEVQALKEQLTK